MSAAEVPDTLEISTRWEGQFDVPPMPPLRSRLSWKPRPIAADAVQLPPDLTMGAFTRVLRDAQILDNRAIDSAGAAVILPYGVELFNRFRQLVHASYRASGLDEHEYPQLIPVSLAAPTGTLMDLHDKLLLVGTASELAGGNAPMTLTPTGEMVIYSHWSRAVSSRSDLPIRIYRRARYFRPASRGHHAGRGIFHAAEHDDVFEFHCAHAGPGRQQEDLARLHAMTVDLIRQCHVPVLWNTRPPWTNRAAIAHRAIAADVPLPLRLTAQVAAIYDQGTRFSEPYRIGFREHGAFHHAEQLAGYVSRRLLMAHLMLGLHQRGRLFIHPDLAPVQVLLLVRQAGAEPPQATAKLVRALRENGILVNEIGCDSAGALTRAGKVWETRGVPLVVQLFAPRTSGDRWKVVIRRADSDEEQALITDDPSGLTDDLRRLLGDIGDSYSCGASSFASSRLQNATLANLPEVLEQRRVAICPLDATETAAKAIAAFGIGEVLGYSRTSQRQLCVLTGKAVDTVAFISPRL